MRNKFFSGAQVVGQGPSDKKSVGRCHFALCGLNCQTDVVANNKLGTSELASNSRSTNLSFTPCSSF